MLLRMTSTDRALLGSVRNAARVLRAFSHADQELGVAEQAAAHPIGDGIRDLHHEPVGVVGPVVLLLPHGCEQVVRAGESCPRAGLGSG